MKINYLKKFHDFYILIFIFAICYLIFNLNSAFAASVSFSPAIISVKEGGTFNISVFIDPQSEKNYSFKLELKYPSDLIKVESFNFKNGWIQLSQPGYDLIDNTHGVLLKTAGYPGGISQNTLFGTVSFKTIKYGNGTIKLGQESLSFNATSQNVLTNYSVQTIISVNKKQETQQQENIEQNLSEEFNEAEKPTTKNIEQSTVVNTEINVATETVAAGQITISRQIPKISLLAFIGKITKNIVANSNDSITGLIILAVIIIIFVIVGSLYKKRKNKFN